MAAELGRWGLTVDDSAGAPLDRLPVGIFARLLAETVGSDGDPVTILALAKHPLAAFGMRKSACRRAARMLELALFRGRRVVGGIGKLEAALAEQSQPEDENGRRGASGRRRIAEDDRALAAELARHLAELLLPLETAFAGRNDVPVSEAATLLLTALVGAATDDTGAEGIAAATGGAALVALLEGLAESGGLAMPASDFPFFLSELMRDVAVQRPAGADPRVHIWGTLEARLQSVDVMVLAGLDEGVWPTATRTDPFLSRAMRAEVGLPPPERRIGLAAHDFAEGMAAKRVIVARAEKRGGAPTVESRWLQRLRAVAGKTDSDAMTARGRRFVEFARALDLPEQDRPEPIERPAPKPPVGVRPRKLSITEIETLIRDPYATYAKHVLRLRPLDDIGMAPDSALRGTLMHDALGRFTNEWNADYDAAAERQLRAFGAELFETIRDFGDAYAVWTLRFGTIARWFVGWEAERAAKVAIRHAEVDGALEIASSGGAFTLRGRADRIDEMRDGTLEIYDFKTGTPQTERTVFAGLTPQMTLEAAMVRAGAFEKIAGGGSVSDLAWLSIGRAGRGDPYVSAVLRNETADDLADRALAMMTDLVRKFDQEDWPYLSRARPMMQNARYLGDYDHLARVREWALVESAADVAMMGQAPG